MSDVLLSPALSIGPNLGSARLARRARTPAPLIIAILGHVVLGALLLRAALPEPPPAAEAAAIRLVFAPAAVAPAAVPPAPAQAAAAPPVPASARQIRHDHPIDQHRPAARATPPAVPRPTRQSMPQPARQAALTQPAPAQPAAAASPAQPSAPATPGLSGAALASLENRIDQAVRAAAQMPAAARRQRREGRAQVRFVYVDGAIRDLTLAQSSESRLLDDAALSAVRAAQIPPPPPLLRGHQLALSVWLDFRMAS